LLPTFLISNDPERRNGRYFALFIHNLAVLEANYVKKVIKIDPYFMRQKCNPKNLVFSNIWRKAIFVIS